MKLNLKRPLAFFDLETTGTNIVSTVLLKYLLLNYTRMERKR